MIGSGAFDWHIAKNLLFQVNGSYQNYHLINPQTGWNYPSGNSIPTAPNPANTYGQTYAYDKSNTYNWGSNVKWDINDIFTLRGAYQHMDSYESAIYNLNNLQNNDGTYNQSHVLYAPFKRDNDAYSLYLDSKFRTWFIEHKFTMGWSGSYAEYDPHTTETSSTSSTGLTFSSTFAPEPMFGHTGGQFYRIGKTDTSNWQLGDEIKFNEQWSVMAGANLTDIEQTNENTTYHVTSHYDKQDVTPAESLIFKPVPSITTYFTYMEGLQSGSVVGLGFTNTGQALAPYLSSQYEVGAKATVDGVLLTGALFRIDKANTYSNNAQPLPTLTEDGRQVNQGVEVTATGKVTRDLTVYGGFTIMDLTVEKTNTPGLAGKEPTGSAPEFAKLYVEYNLPWVKGLTLTGGGYWTHSMFNNSANTQEVPGYVTGDLGARYETRFYNVPTTFRLNVTNVADAGYWSSLGTMGVPRNIAFSMQVKF